MPRNMAGGSPSSTAGQKGRLRRFVEVALMLVGIPAALWTCWTVVQRVTDAPRLRVREVVPVIRPDQPVEVKLTFSVVGMHFDPVFVNKVLLREDVRPPSVDLRFRTVVEVPRLEDHVQVGPAQEPPAPRIGSIRTADGRLPDPPQASRIREIFQGARRRLDADDQLDFLLTITVDQPPATGPGEQPVLVKWIGLEVHWEDAQGSPGVLGSLVGLPLVDLGPYTALPGTSRPQ